MQDLKEVWKVLIGNALVYYAKSQNIGIASQIIFTGLQAETPTSSEHGDLAFPLFPFAKLLKKAPAQLAVQLAMSLSIEGQEWKALNTTLDQSLILDFESGNLGTVKAEGPYCNVSYHRAAFQKDLLESMALVEQEGRRWGSGKSLAGQRVLVEFSSPNTNKPLHLGHLRNNALGESTSRILTANGAEVRKVNLFNDRGIHICKSMVAYQRWGNEQDPKQLGLKSDHYVAQLYVRFQNELKSQIAALRLSRPDLIDQDDDALWLVTEIGASAQEMLKAWENDDLAVKQLWAIMNRWAVDGIMETYRKTGIAFDWIQYEHETYLMGKEEVKHGLASGAFFKRADGAVVVELPWKDSAQSQENAQKVVLRADGTSIYLTQDLGTAINRHQTWPFDQAVYVVANEQDYHFKVLFHCLAKLGHTWANKLHHLSYGLVNLPSGRMKTREGTVVDADDLLDELSKGAEAEIRNRGREADVAEVQGTAFNVALAALHYYLLQVSPDKDMIFNPEESLSFNGNTGPYLQYMGARICSMIRKWPHAMPLMADLDAQLLQEDQAWELAKLLESWPALLAQAGAELDPSRVACRLYDIAKAFSRFYHDLPVINASDQRCAQARLLLSMGVEKVLRTGFELLNLPFLEAM